jgi:hypothetical protein
MSENNVVGFNVNNKSNKVLLEEWLVAAREFADGRMPLAHFVDATLARGQVVGGKDDDEYFIPTKRIWDSVLRTVVAFIPQEIKRSDEGSLIASSHVVKTLDHIASHEDFDEFETIVCIDFLSMARKKRLTLGNANERNLRKMFAFYQQTYANG